MRYKINKKIKISTSSKALGKSTHTYKFPRPASVYYKVAESGVNENDLVHIVVPKLYIGSQIVKQIGLRIGDSINITPENKGIVITDIKVSKLRRKTLSHTFQGRFKGEGGGHIVLTINRDAEYTPADVLQRIQNQILPQVRLTNPKIVVFLADLPGDSTGPGPAELPGDSTGSGPAGSYSKKR